MTNLTITTDDDVLKKARLRAISEGTSVNAVLREFLESYAGIRKQRESAMKSLLLISEKSTSSRGDRKWSREDLHTRKHERK